MAERAPDGAPAETPEFSITVVTLDRRDLALRAIASAYEQEGPSFEVIVVDNGSSDGTPEAVARTFPAATLITLPSNVGCPSGRNVAFEAARGRYVLCLDDDGYLDKGALTEVSKAFAAEPHTGIVALRQKYPDEPGEGRIRGDGGRFVADFSGGLCAMRRDMLMEVGGYPDDFFFFAEEQYLALKVLDAGYDIVAQPGAVVWHPRGRGSEAGGNPMDYYLFRNPLLVVLRLFPTALAVRYFFLRTGSYALISWRRGSTRQYLRAMAHVIRNLPAELRRREPCRSSTIRRYFDLRDRGAGSGGEAADSEQPSETGSR
jgi:hypothetical protein